MKNPKKSFLKRLKKHSELMHKKEFVEPVYFYQKSYDSLIVKFHKKQTYTDIELFLKEAMIEIEEIIKKIS